MMALNLMRQIGAQTLLLAGLLGRSLIYVFDILVRVKRNHLYLKSIYQQILNIGFYSLPVVSLTAIFSGAVLAMQSYASFSKLNVEYSVPTVVALSLTKELGPVLVGLMVAGRVGSSIAAEIASMKVSEQIDALFVLSVDPLKYLAIPRLLAAAITLPCLILVADVIGIGGGYIIGVHKLGINGAIYLQNTLQSLKTTDIISGSLKGLVFGLVVVATSCFAGYRAGIGARGVGEATIKAVVLSSILILICNYLITLLLVF